MHPGILSGPATPRLVLPDVTLVAVTSVALPQTVRALRLSMTQIAFGATVLLSDQPPTDADGIAWRQIARLASREAYSHFMLRDLRDHVATGHVLCVQWDGYVLDAANWSAEFLDYDYIGAPWPHFGDGHTVGNGGFSLRSRRLIDACCALGLQETPEDLAIARTHRTELERRFGLRFAPETLARRFAYERYPRTGREFGFHGAFNLVHAVDRATLDQLIAGLEDGILSRREHRELLRVAVRYGRITLARTVMRRMRARGWRD